MSSTLYSRLFLDLAREIESGRRPVGSRLPSIRQLSRERGISKSTVLAAYDRLEAEGLIAARPRSGYYVIDTTTRDAAAPRLPQTSQPECTPLPVTSGQILLDIMQRGTAFDLLKDTHHEQGNTALRRCLSRAQRRQTLSAQQNYDEPQGSERLRLLLSQRLMQGGSRIGRDELVITGGCQHALMLALMATTRPGDIVAVESPGYYGVLQLIEALNLKALELPSSASHGLSPDALELALQHWPVKVLVVSPSYGTPTGACMPESNKQRILELMTRKGVPVIEDDIYGELSFSGLRPPTLHSYDKSGSVLLCSSVSKSLSRDLRVGWIAPGRYLDQVRHLKLVTTLASCQAQQEGLAFYLEAGNFDRYLRLRRERLRIQYRELRELLHQHLPMLESCSQPRGGLSLWLELPASIDTIQLYHRAQTEGLVLTPGRLFTAQSRYGNALRLSFAFPWTEQRQKSVTKLGMLIREQLSQP
ncbi:MAG: PLP-dependent aminotransferase family protein [Chromatiales bacterium]|nr:PLP-dependent aminotransferase family protein [Chromatiales bacterium]